MEWVEVRGRIELGEAPQRKKLLNWIKEWTGIFQVDKRKSYYKQKEQHEQRHRGMKEEGTSNSPMWEEYEIGGKVLRDKSRK